MSKAKKTGAASFEDDVQLRSQYGNLLRRHIDASTQAVSDLADRWDVAEALYNLDYNEVGLNTVEGLKSYPIPIWKPKADRIIGTIFQGITGIDPYVQVLTDDGSNERAEGIEKTLQLMAGRGNTKDTFDRAFLQGITIGVNTNIALLYVHKKKEGGVSFKAVHPKDAVAYPHEMGCIDDMVTVGHRFYKMRSWVEDQQLAGYYLPGTLGSADSKVGDEAGRSSAFAMIQDTEGVEQKDDILRLYQICHKCELGEGYKWYLFTLAYDDQVILKVEDYPYSRPFYFDLRFADEYGTFWPANSPGYSMQALQKAYTDLHNVIIQGAYATAFPNLVFEGGSMPVKYKRNVVGGVWEVPAGVKVSVLANQFRGEQLMQMIPQLEKIADSVSRISQLGTSQNLPSSTTATAAAGMLKAQEEGKDQYTAFVAPSVADIWRFLYELLEKHFDEFKSLYGVSMPLETREDLSGTPLRFEATGKSADTNPRVLLEKMQMLLQMSQAPDSRLDYQKVEGQVVQNMNIPLDMKSLEKDAVSGSEQIMQELMNMGATPEMVFGAISQLIEGAKSGQGDTGANPEGQPVQADFNGVLPVDGGQAPEGSGVAGPY